MAKSIDPPVISHEVGEKVYAKWYGKYYSAVITRAKEDKYDVRFDDNKTRRGLTKKSIVSRGVVGAPHQVGDRVEALFEGEGEDWYPARIAAVVPKGDNSFGFHILYDDKDVDRDLAAEFVRLPSVEEAVDDGKQPASNPEAGKKQPASKPLGRSDAAKLGWANLRKREAAEREAALEEEVENNSQNDREDADDGKPAGKRRKVADAPEEAEEETDDAPEDTLEGDHREREELNALKRKALALEEANKKLEGTVEGLREKVASLEQDRERVVERSAPGNDAPEGERGDDEAKSADSADAASKPAAKKKKKKKKKTRVTLAVDPNEEGEGPEIGVWSIEALRECEQKLKGKGLGVEQVEAEMAKLCTARSRLIAEQNGAIMLPIATKRAWKHKRNAIDPEVNRIRSAAAVARGIVTLGEKALLGNEGVPGYAEFRALLNVPGGIGENRAQVGELERKIETLEGRMRDDFEDIIEKGKKEFAVYQDTPETVEERIDLLMGDMFEA